MDELRAMQGSTAGYCSNSGGREHYMSTHIRGGALVAVPICTFCGWIDFDDIDEQVRKHMSDMEIDGKTLGQVAFEAYRAEVQGTAYDDKPIPPWDEMHGNRERAHRGWEVAAAEVARYTRLGLIAEKAMEGPRVARERPTRWVPLGTEAPVEERVEGGAVFVFEPLPPVGDDTVAQARTSVPVEADDETGDDAV